MNPPHTQAVADPLKEIRWLIWIYMFLLIFEGALRKWILPGLANPLLIVLDPVAILIYALAYQKGVFPENGLVGAINALGVFTFLISLVTGYGNLLVSVFGWRTDFLHLPLIFLMGKVLDERDVKRLCTAMLIIAVPMAFLVMAQFKADPLAWINRGVGTGEGGQLDVGFGKIRPPGTFSFTNGLANYIGLVAGCLLYAVIDRKYYPRWLLFTAAPATGLMIMISGSRATVSAVVISVIFLALICIRRPTYVGNSFKFVLLALPGLWLISLLPVFQEGQEVLGARFGESTGGVQHGIIERALSDYTSGFDAIPDTPLFGMGLGMGTNAAAGMLSGGQRSFLLAEGEWPRVVKEGGPIFGLGFLLLRIVIVFYLFMLALGALEKHKPLGLLIFSATALPVLNGQFGQPTALGFAVFGGGLCLAAANEARETARDEVVVATAPLHGRRGRSVYAEMLHKG